MHYLENSYEIFQYLSSKDRQKLSEVNYQFKQLHRAFFMKFIAKRLFTDLTISGVKNNCREDFKYALQLENIDDNNEDEDRPMKFYIQDIDTNTYLINKIDTRFDKNTFNFYAACGDSLDHFIILGKNISKVSLFINGSIVYKKFYIKSDIVKFKPCEVCLPLSLSLKYCKFELKIEADEINTVYIKVHYAYDLLRWLLLDSELHLNIIVFDNGAINYEYVCKNGVGMFLHSASKDMYQKNMLHIKNDLLT